MKPATILALLILTSLLRLSAQAPAMKKINRQVKTTPYVFGGIVVSNEVYAGDREGNRLPPGVFTLPDGSNAVGYFSTTIQVCKIYKGAGKIKHGTIEIITTSRELSVFPSKDSTGKDKTGYTIMGTGHENEILFRHPPGTRVILFCGNARYEGDSQRAFDNGIGVYPVGATGIFYNLWKRSSSDINAYGFGREFFSEEEITRFMRQIKRLDHKAANVCTDNDEGLIAPEGDRAGFE